MFGRSGNSTSDTARMKEQIALAKSELAEVSEKKKRGLRVVANGDPVLDRILDDEDFAILCLNSENAAVRDFALSALDCFDRDYTAQLPVFERIAFSDPEPEIRRGAYTWLGAGARNDKAKTKELGVRLANIVVDDLQSVEERIAAYQGLYSLEDNVAAFIESLGVRSLSSVDWIFVNKWRTEGETRLPS